MRTSHSMVLAFASLTLPSTSYSQDLPRGVWTGTLALSGGPQLAIEFAVTTIDGSYAITMNVVDGPASPVSPSEVTRERMQFRWGAFECELTRTGEARFTGKCLGDDRTEAKLTLTPPPAVPAVADPPPQDADDRDRNVLRTEDLLSTRASNVYDALQRLRPQWLRARGPARIGRVAVVQVYLDHQPMGGVDFLRTLEPDAVAEIRFLTAAEATTEYGSQNEGGVIAVTRRR